MYDSVLVEQIVLKAYVFFDTIVVHEYYYETVLKESIAKSVVNELLSLTMHEVSKPRLNRQNYSLDVELSTSNVSTLNDFTTGETAEMYSEYMCIHCKQNCISLPLTYDEQSIECSTCKYWFHLRCVKLAENDKRVKGKRSKWFCSKCLSET